MKRIVIGIMPQEKIRERMLAIAKGAYKSRPGEPKVWFASMKSLAGLAAITGRKPSNLSRTLKTMSHYGIVEMRRENRCVHPIVNATEFQILTAQ
jgi:predicted transcriptional regulator